MDKTYIEECMYFIVEKSNDIVTILFLLLSSYILIRFIFSPSSSWRGLDRFLRLFFYDENNASSKDIKEIFLMIDNRFKILEDDFLKKAFNDKENFISENIEKFIDDNLRNLINMKLTDTSILQDTVIGNLDETVKLEFNKYISNLDIATILKEKYESLKIERLINSIRQLEKTIEQERTSSGRLKTIMINLFVVFNIGIIITYITWGSHISDNAIYAITGLYLSLATFIFYIIRTSHFRTGVLLSITEDNKKHLDVLDFLNGRTNQNISEQDVELIKLFLINRAEREHKADHPYEVILKGISGSNIQFKGGKMSLGKEK